MLIQLKTLSYKVVLLSMVVGLLGFTIALAASGDLDTTFSGDGRVITNFGPSPGRVDELSGIAIQPNGKIIAVGFSSGDFALTRYNVDGSLDTTFSGDGKVTTNFGGYDTARDIALQSNGKIVVSGQKSTVDRDVALARYNANGTLDTSFSDDGKQSTEFGGDNGSEGGLAIQSNGKIVMAGYAWNHNSTDKEFAIYRYNPNGSIDLTFTGDGVAIGNFGVNQFDVTRDLAIQSDGKIVVVGESGSNESAEDFDFAIARLNPNGTADLTFSGDGRQRTNFGGLDTVSSVAVGPNGKIVVVGYRVPPLNNNRTEIAVVRYNPNGSLDTTFNGTGRKAFSINGSLASFAKDVIVQSDGKIVLLADTNGDLVLVRLNSNGSFDTTFHGDGKVIVDFGAVEWASALARQPSDGKYVIGGQTNAGTPQSDFALARVLP